MNWTELLKQEAEFAYNATVGLMDLVDEDQIDWKPETGDNWMSVAQLLHHQTNACGFCFKGFVTGDWSMPEGPDVSEMSDDEMLPPAGAMPAVESVAQARELLAADKELAFRMIEKAGEERLGSEMASAPWDPNELLLGRQLLMMINHLGQHKGQLYYYLKLQGKPVNTAHLWGMAPPPSD